MPRDEQARSGRDLREALGGGRVVVVCESIPPRGHARKAIADFVEDTFAIHHRYVPVYRV